MRTSFALWKYRAWCRFNCYDLDVRILWLEVFANTCKCTACTNTSYKDVNLSVCLIPDFRTCCLSVSFSVCRVYELTEDYWSFNLLVEFVCLCNGTLHALCAFCENEVCTVCWEKCSSFNAHCIRKCKDSLVTLSCCYCCKTDTSVTACRFDNCCSWLEDALLFSVFNHCECDCIVVEFENRCSSDKFEWTLLDVCHNNSLR